MKVLNVAADRGSIQVLHDHMLDSALQCFDDPLQIIELPINTEADTSHCSSSLQMQTQTQTRMQTRAHGCKTLAYGKADAYDVARSRKYAWPNGGVPQIRF